MNKLKNSLKFSIVLLLVLFILLFLYRTISPKHLDDLHPDIPCDRELIEKSDFIAVIPLYNNKSITKNKEWCEYIKNFNKTLVMHGVYHTFNEFNEVRNYKYIQQGIKEFENCFGYSPSEFKPPQLAISRENRQFIEKEFGLKVHTWFSQRFHKVYHCNNTGVYPNWLADLI